MTHWPESRLAAHLKRLGVEGAPNTASTAEVPFLPTFPVIITLPMCPSTNALFFNGKPGKGRIKTPEYVDWIEAAGWELAAQRPPGVPGRVKILIEVAEPETKRRQDVANREKATIDLLVSHRIIEGDDQRFVREITMRWADISGIRITITPCG